MHSANADTYGKHHIASTAFIVLLVVSVCGLMLTGCKKDKEKSEAGDISSPASVILVPEEVSPSEGQATLPSADMKGLSVHTIPRPSDSPSITIPDMKPVSGMDMSVRVSQQMMKALGWTQNFATLYKPVNDCLEQVDGGAAYAANVTETNQDIAVQMVGLDGHWRECRITAAGGRALSMTTIDEQPEAGPLFFPRSAGRPLLNNPQCYSMEAVVARPGGLIGWLAYAAPDCRLTNNP